MADEPAISSVGFGAFIRLRLRPRICGVEKGILRLMWVF
jgi:hypothetical protein